MTPLHSDARRRSEAAAGTPSLVLTNGMAHFLRPRRSPAGTRGGGSSRFTRIGAVEKRDVELMNGLGRHTRGSYVLLAVRTGSQEGEFLLGDFLAQN